MKAQITFNCETSQDIRFIANYEAAYCVLHDFAQELRKKLKYEQLTEEQSKVWEQVKEIFYELCFNERIDPLGE